MADKSGKPAPKKTPKEVHLKPAWKKGQSGNPKGRPKGSRNKLGQAFFDDMLKDWEKHGAAAIVRVREEKPDAYVKVVASILPKDVNVNLNKFEDLTDAQLRERIAQVAGDLGTLAEFGIGATADRTQKTTRH